MSTDQALAVLEDGRPITFGFADLMRYHGHSFPGGVAHAFAAMRAAFPLLDGGRPVERREVVVRTAFKGPGGHDALEMVTRGRSEGRASVVPDLGEPERGILQNYVWEFTYRGATITVHVADAGIVAEEFIAFGGKADRTEAESSRLEVLKLEMTERLNARPADDVYLPL